MLSELCRKHLSPEIGPKEYLFYHHHDGFGSSTPRSVQPLASEHGIWRHLGASCAGRDEVLDGLARLEHRHGCERDDKQ
jgi:hypothetical protein